MAILVRNMRELLLRCGWRTSAGAALRWKSKWTVQMSPLNLDQRERRSDQPMAPHDCNPVPRTSASDGRHPSAVHVQGEGFADDENDFFEGPCTAGHCFHDERCKTGSGHTAILQRTASRI